MIGKRIIAIHEEGKIDVHHRAFRYEQYLEKLRSDKTLLQENRDLILRFLRDCSLGKTFTGRARRKIGPGRLLKYIGILRFLSARFAKSFDLVNQDDMERFVERLETNLIKKLNGANFAEATKADIKKTIKKFWKWKDGKGKVYPELVEWIDSHDPIKEIPALPREEVEKMIEYSSNARDKALLMVLFDSGARAEEILNVRLKPEHLMWIEDGGYFKIRLEFSKTKPRTISVPLSTRLLQAWLEVHPARENPQAQLFPLTYGNLRMLVRRIGERVLGKKVSPHMLRHSSATFYANKLGNRFQLCYRYGWTMSSRVVDRYLDREGILENATVDAILADQKTSTEKVKQVYREELSTLRESHMAVQEELKGFKAQLDELRDGKGILSLLMGLKDRSPDLERLDSGFDLVVGGGRKEK